MDSLFDSDNESNDQGSSSQDSSFVPSGMESEDDDDQHGHSVTGEAGLGVGSIRRRLVFEESPGVHEAEHGRLQVETPEHQDGDQQDADSEHGAHDDRMDMAVDHSVEANVESEHEPEGNNSHEHEPDDHQESNQYEPGDDDVEEPEQENLPNPHFLATCMAAPPDDETAVIEHQCFSENIRPNYARINETVDITRLESFKRVTGLNSTPIEGREGREGRPVAMSASQRDVTLNKIAIAYLEGHGSPLTWEGTIELFNQCKQFIETIGTESTQNIVVAHYEARHFAFGNPRGLRGMLARYAMHTAERYIHYLVQHGFISESQYRVGDVGRVFIDLHYDRRKLMMALKFKQKTVDEAVYYLRLGHWDESAAESIILSRLLHKFQDTYSENVIEHSLSSHNHSMFDSDRHLSRIPETLTGLWDEFRHVADRNAINNLAERFNYEWTSVRNELVFQSHLARLRSEYSSDEYSTEFIERMLLEFENDFEATKHILEHQLEVLGDFIEEFTTVYMSPEYIRRKFREFDYNDDDTRSHLFFETNMIELRNFYSNPEVFPDNILRHQLEYHQGSIVETRLYLDNYDIYLDELVREFPQMDREAIRAVFFKNKYGVQATQHEIRDMLQPLTCPICEDEQNTPSVHYCSVCNRRICADCCGRLHADIVRDFRISYLPSWPVCFGCRSPLYEGRNRSLHPLLEIIFEDISQRLERQRVEAEERERIQRETRMGQGHRG